MRQSQGPSCSPGRQQPLLSPHLSTALPSPPGSVISLQSFIKLVKHDFSLVKPCSSPDHFLLLDLPEMLSRINFSNHIPGSGVRLTSLLFLGSSFFTLFEGRHDIFFPGLSAQLPVTTNNQIFPPSLCLLAQTSECVGCLFWKMQLTKSINSLSHFNF